MDETTTDTPTPNPTPEPETPNQDQPRGSRILREWGFDVETFEKRAKESLEAARGDFAEIKVALRQAASDTKQVLCDLQRTRGPVATEIKSGFERAWDEIEKAFTRARERMKESQAAAPPAEHQAAPENEAPPQ